MPGQVGVDNAGKHSPNFNKYNTLDQYKKTSRQGTNYNVPSFSFGTAKRKIGMAPNASKLGRDIPGPGQYYPPLDEMAQKGKRYSNPTNVAADFS